MSKPTTFGNDREFHRFRQMMAQAVGLQQKGDYSRAEGIYAQILAETPDQPDALHYWGLLKHLTGDGAEAIRLMKKSLEVGFPNAGYFYNLGGVLQQQGLLLEATEYLRKTVELTPSHTRAWKCLGEIYEEMNMLFKASECYRKAYELEPGNRELALSLVRVLRHTGGLEEAIKLCETQLQTRPEDAEMAFFQAQCLIDAAKPQQALETLRTALRTDPLSAKLQHAMGMLMSELGNFDSAKEHFAHAIEIDPQFYGAYFSLTAIRNFSGEDAATDELERKISQIPPKNPLSVVSAEFALGKMFEDQGRYDRAFAHFQRGNKTMRGLMKYSTAAQQGYVDSLIEHLDSDFISAHSAVGSESDKPVFILGMLRSGTSLVEQILASHPHVAGGGELMFLPQALRKYTEAPTIVSGDKIAALPDATLRAIGEDYLKKLGQFYPEAGRVTDKLPGNFMMIGLIRTLFPRARIIHCVRDPVDTCVSCYLTHFDGGHPYAYDLQEIGEYHRMYRGLMEHYEKILPADAMLTVRYEDLVADIETGSRRLVGFCGLDWDPACLEFNKASRAVKTASLYQVRQTPYTRSIGRWRNYSSHLEPLQKALVAAPTPA